jgi:hypothetical protein
MKIFKILLKRVALYKMFKVIKNGGHAIAQAVSRWRVRARVCSCGIYGGHSGTGAGFLRVLRFPLPNFIPQIAPQSPSSVIWSWYNNGRRADSGLPH